MVGLKRYPAILSLLGILAQLESSSREKRGTRNQTPGSLFLLCEIESVPLLEIIFYCRDNVSTPGIIEPGCLRLQGGLILKSNGKMYKNNLFI